jgi:hypothetical protein
MNKNQQTLVNERFTNVYWFFIDPTAVDFGCGVLEGMDQGKRPAANTLLLQILFYQVKCFCKSGQRCFAQDVLKG